MKNLEEFSMHLFNFYYHYQSIKILWNQWESINSESNNFTSCTDVSDAVTTYHLYSNLEVRTIYGTSF